MAIKSTLVTPPNKAKEIDWDKPQLVECEGQIVMTNGIHKGSYFSGVALCRREIKCLIEDDWYKPKF